MQTQPLGRTDLRVPRLGLGTMTWGEPAGLSRYTPAKLAYGGAEGADEEARAFHGSLAAGVTLFDTAAMYSNGASELRLGELAHGTPALIATKFPPRLRDTAEDLPGALAASLARLGRTPGAKNAHQAEANARALTFTLTPDELQALDTATRSWRT